MTRLDGWQPAAVGANAGMVLGAVRGSGYLPTLPFALLEGGILIGLPATSVGGVVAGVWELAHQLRSRRG